MPSDQGWGNKTGIMKAAATIAERRPNGEVIRLDREIDVIEYDGRLWLALSWTDAPSSEWIMPSRLVSLARVSCQSTGDAPLALRINDALPSGLFDSQLSAELAEQFEVIDKPRVQFLKRSDRPL